MLIEWRTEGKEESIDLTVNETETWLHIRLEDFESEEEFRKRAQELIDERYNRLEYNQYRKLGRHRSDVTTYDLDGEKVINADEGLFQEAANKNSFTKYEDEYRHQRKVEQALEIARKILNKKQYELFYAIAYEGYSIKEYALEKGTSENNISHKYRRILKKLSEKRPIYISEVAYK